MKITSMRQFRNIFLFQGVICLSVFTCISNSAVGQNPNPIPVVYPSTGTLNYVRTWTATAPEQNTTNLVNRALTDVKQVTQYTDAFGRVVQVVAKQASPKYNDIITANYYDPTTGDEVYKYLPFTSTSAATGDVMNDGNFKPDRFQQQVAFYNTYLTGQPGETNVGTNSLNWAYNKTNIESSPQRRVLNTFAPGTNWAGSETGSTPHKSKQSFCVNTLLDAVQKWTIVTNKTNPQSLGAETIPTNISGYAAGTLDKKISTDEQGHQVVEFKDLYGQLILKKVQNTATADNGLGSAHAGWLCTYYVYDDYGNLRFIIPPNVVQLLDGNWTGMTQSFVDELCFYFQYDNLDRMVIKKSPGTFSGAAGEIWMVYDKRDRLVMQQDGKQRSQKLWKYFVYDGLDRITITGLLTDPSAITTGYTDLNSQLISAAGTTTWPSSGGFTTELLSQEFYDNYSWMNATNSSTLATVADATANGFANSVFSSTYNKAPNYAVQPIQSKMTHGLCVGKKTEVMLSGQTQYLYAVNFFDSKGRVIQSQKINYVKGTDIFSRQYTWDGRMLATLEYNNIPSVSSTNPQTHWIGSTMTFDNLGRLMSVAKKINSVVNGTAVASYSSNVVSYQYDELNRLQKKTLGNNLETLAYDYNVRGWLLGENRNYLSGASTTNYFGFELNYDKTVSAAPPNTAVYSNAIFNGNTGGTVWKSRGDATLRKFDYSYDNISRLTAASFNQYSGSVFDKSAGMDFSAVLQNYDGNGNIGKLQQNGFLVSSSPLIDNITYTYALGQNATTGANYSNRLTNVTDQANMASSTLGDLHYPTSKPAGNIDYGYDANGNITSDYNRNISLLTYQNDLNLPNQITVGGKGTVTYVYDASGNKLQKQTVESNVVVNYGGTNYTTGIQTTTKYIDGFVYKTVFYTLAALSALNTGNTDVLQFAPHQSGRIRFKPALGAVPASYAFDYYIKDQTNNVRMILTDETGTDTYPAATLETVPKTVNGITSTPQAYESSYYSINTGNVIPVSTLSWWSTITGVDQNQNNNGTPVNNDPYSTPTATSANVYKLNGMNGDKTGLGMTLKVMAGDVINIYGSSVWHSTAVVNQNYLLTSSLVNFFTAFATSAPVIFKGDGLATATALSTTSSTATVLTPMLNGYTKQVPNSNNPPNAAINWILFDDQFRAVNMGTTLVNPQPNIMTPHSFPLNIPMQKNGYLYVFCSNESDKDVYFDNLQVTLAHGLIEEETHYYPTGLAIASISDRAFGKQSNYYHYQDKELQSQEWYDGTGLEEYDFNSRFYDQQIGLWHNQDHANQFASPYLAMGNNWVNGQDPNGQWFGLDDIIVSAVGLVAGYLSYGIEKHHWGGKAILSGLAGAAIAEGGYLTLGGGLTAVPGTTEAGAAATVGGAGSIAGAESFSTAYSISLGKSLLFNSKQISGSSDWGAFGLIAGYSFLASVDVGFSVNSTPDEPDYLSGSAGARETKAVADANSYNPANAIDNPPGAWGAGIGGYLSDVGYQFLQSYNPKTNSWDLKGKYGRIAVTSLLEGGLGNYLGQGVTGGVLEDNERSDFDFANSPAWIDFFTEKWPDIKGRLINWGDNLFWSKIIFPKWAPN